MNEVLEAMKSRRSCRSFKSDAVPQEVIDQICEAGTFAASGMNRQPCKILVIKDKALRDRLAVMNAGFMGKGADFDPFYGAPVVLVVIADKSSSTYLYDGSLMIGNLMLAAHTLGLGSCWIHRAKEEFETAECKALMKELGIEGEFEGIGHVALGYDASSPRNAPPRRENAVYTIG